MSIRQSALFGACALTTLLSACDFETPTHDLALEVAPLELAPNTWQVAFTNPGTSAATAVDMPIDEQVVQAITQATTSIDIAVFGFDHPAITQAVLGAHARGVAVRVVGHGAELDTSDDLKAIQQAGVPLVLRPTTALMHHKFMVVDGHLVAFGSMNFTTFAADQNDENLVFVDSPALADIFEGEFEQMFAGMFGAKKVARAERPTVPVEGGSIALHFSPKEQTSTRLREVIASAQTRIYFMTYSFTLADVANELVAARQRGVEVVGVFDKGSAASRYSQDDYLAANGVAVYLDGNENTSGFAGGRLHDKVMIVDAGADGPMVVTGSYNWSAGATDDNDETLAILSGDALVAPFVAEFCRIYAISSAATQQVAPPTLCQDRPLVALTEVMANPDGIDKNEEYVELVNLGNAAADLSGWTLGDLASPARHVFAPGTTLAPHAALVVYSGLAADGSPRLIASTLQLSVNNDAETVTLRDANGQVIDQVALGVGISGESVHRAEEGLADVDFDGVVDGGQWGRHGALCPTGLRSSPGLRVTGEPWLASPTEGPTDPTQGESDVDDVLIGSALPNPVGADRPEEYVVIVNHGLTQVDLSGWAIGDLASPYRHVFPVGASLAPGASLKIYDGGVHADGVPASSGALSLNNDSETMSLVDAHGDLVSTLSWRNAAEGVVVAAP